jgi:hypothetical protein
VYGCGIIRSHVQRPNTLPDDVESLKALVLEQAGAMRN